MNGFARERFARREGTQAALCRDTFFDAATSLRVNEFLTTSGPVVGIVFEGVSWFHEQANRDINPGLGPNGRI